MLIIILTQIAFQGAVVRRIDGLAVKFALVGPTAVGEVRSEDEKLA
jgi:hypothetical protein